MQKSKSKQRKSKNNPTSIHVLSIQRKKRTTFYVDIDNNSIDKMNHDKSFNKPDATVRKNQNTIRNRNVSPINKRYHTHNREMIEDNCNYNSHDSDKSNTSDNSNESNKKED